MSSARTVIRSTAVGSFTISEVAYAPGVILGRHAHPTARFCAVTAGHYREDYVGRQLDCVAGSVTFRPAGALHANRFLERTRCLMIESLAGRCEDLLDAASPTQNDRAFDFALRIQREMSRPDAASALILEGLLLQFAGMHARDTAPPAAVPEWLTDLRDHLGTDTGARASLCGLAAEWNVHPSYMATAFRRVFGCTIGDFKRRRRIGRALESLRRDDLPLAQVALDCGFSDQSHFSREFKRAVGVTPSRFRRDQSRSKT